MCRSKRLIDLSAKAIGKKDAARMASKTPFDGLVNDYDIPYLDDGNVYHLLDVYRPANIPEGKKLPVIIDIHGGAWIYGTKEINAHYCQGLAKYGYCVVNINYRLITEEGKGTFPALLDDCFAAFKWVENNIADYGGDLSDVFLTGDSAGAHMASMCLAINGDKELREELNMKTNIEFRALALTCGVSDVEFFLKVKLPVIRYLFKLFFGKDWKKNPYLRTATLRNMDLSVLPPVFLNTSFGDFMRPQVLAFDKLLTERNVPHELFYIDKKSVHKLEHVYSVINPEWEESISTTDALIAFFKKYEK